MYKIRSEKIQRSGKRVVLGGETTCSCTPRADSALMRSAMVNLICLAGNPKILKEMLLMLKKVTCTKIKIGVFFLIIAKVVYIPGGCRISSINSTSIQIYSCSMLNGSFVYFTLRVKELQYTLGTGLSQRNILKQNPFIGTVHCNCNYWYVLYINIYIYVFIYDSFIIRIHTISIEVFPTLVVPLL